MFNRIPVILGIAIISVSGFPSDPNAHLFEHMLPVFQQEENARISAQSHLSLPNETEHSLGDAKLKLAKLVSLGHLSQAKADKLFDALTAAQEIRRVAKMLETYNVKPRMASK